MDDSQLSSYEELFGSQGNNSLNFDNYDLPASDSEFIDHVDIKRDCHSDYSSNYDDKEFISTRADDKLMSETDSFHEESTPKVSFDNLLIINDTLQVLVKELLENISNESLTLKSMAEHLTHQFNKGNTINHESMSNDSDPNSEGDLFRRFSYFVSSDGQTPPPNEDHMDRARRGEFNIFSIIKYLKKGNVLFRKNEVIKAVADDKREQILSHLKDDLQRMKDSLAEAKEMGDTNIGPYLAKIKEIGQKIDSVNALSVSDLISQIETQYDIDRVDWTKLSLQTFKGVASDTNLRLGWMHYATPNVNTRAWTSQEDNRLTELIKELGEHSWEEVAARLETGRTPIICLQRWQRKLNPQYKGMVWTEQEDEILLRAVTSMVSSTNWSGKISWSALCAYLPGKNSSQCYSRWKSINPDILHGPWTEEQDIQLLLSVQRYGIHDWTRISSALPGRRPRSCRDRYHRLMESVQPWSYSDDKRLWLLLNEVKQKSQLTFKTLRKLLPYFPGRSTQSLSSRWQVLKNCKIMLDSLQDYIQPFLKKSVCSGVSNLSKIKDHVVYSPLIKNLIGNMKSQAIDQPEEKVFQMIGNWRNQNNPNCDLNDFMEMIRDLHHGLVIPRPNLTGELTSIEGFASNPVDHAMNLRRVVSTKHLVDRAIRDELRKIASSKCLNELKKKRAIELLEDEATFWMAYEKVCQFGDIQERLYHYRKLSAIQSIVPIFVEKMLRIKLPKVMESPLMTDFSKESENLAPVDLEIASNCETIEIKSEFEIDEKTRCPNVGQYKLMKLVELKRLLEEREEMYGFPKRYAKIKTQSDIQVLRHIPDHMRLYLSTKKVVSSNAKRVRSMLSDALSSTQDAIILRSKSSTKPKENNQVKLDIPVLPLNQATTLGFKTLLLERKKLTVCGLEAVKQMFQVTHRGETDVNSELKLLLDQGVNLEVARKVSENQAAMKTLMSSDTFKLLRNRFLALFAWPALASTLLWSSIVEKRDQHFEELQAHFNEEVSQKSKTKDRPQKSKAAILADQGKEISLFKDLFIKPTLKRRRQRIEFQDELNSDDSLDNDYTDMGVPPTKTSRYSESLVGDLPARNSKIQAIDAIRNFIQKSSSIDFDPNEGPSHVDRQSSGDSLSFELDSGWVVSVPKDLILLISFGFQLESFTHRTIDAEYIYQFSHPDNS